MGSAAPSRAVFATGWGVILTTAGAAIGLGNIWRFPYLMGEYGGSAFLLLYLVLVVAFGIPILMVEYTLGRHTRRGPMGAFQAVSMPGANWWTGLINLTMLMAGSYYAVVLAWVLRCAVTFGWSAWTREPAPSFSSFQASFWLPLGYVAVTLGLSCVAIRLGVRRGIERFSTWILPLFFALFLFVIIWVLRLDGAIEGVREFLVPRPGELTPAAGMVAMGQVFFSLGLAGSIMLIYGSYLREEDSIPRIAIGTSAADVVAALMAGMIVVPAALAYGKPLNEGPTLMFGVLLEVFTEMPLGNLVGAIFFFSVFIVGLLSLIAAFEVVIGSGEDGFGWPRAVTVWVLLAVELGLAVPALLIDQYIRYSDLIWGTTMMPVGSALAVIAVAWCIGRAGTLAEIGRSTRLPVPGFLFYWVKYVLPIGIGAMLVYGWWDAHS